MFGNFTSEGKVAIVLFFFILPDWLLISPFDL